MTKLEILYSFIKGFNRSDISDITNALFIVNKIKNKELPFIFENRDNNGVESPEIRRLLLFNMDELKQQKEIKEFQELGKKMAKLKSNELKWVAQYLKNGKAHLYPEEAKRAQELLKELNNTLSA